MDNLFDFQQQRLEQKKTLLLQVDKAISAIMAGAQSYTIENRSLTRANLKDLMALQKQLEEEISAAESDGFTMSNTKVAFFDRR